MPLPQHTRLRVRRLGPVPVLAALVPLAERQLLLAGGDVVLVYVDVPRDPAAGGAARLAAVQGHELCRLGRAAAAILAAAVLAAATTATSATTAAAVPQASVQAAVEVAGGGQDAGNHVDAGLDEGVNHGPAGRVPGRVAEEGRGEEDGEAQGAGDDAHRRGEKGEHQADLFRQGHLQPKQDRPGDDEHDDVGDEARHAVELVEEHDIAARAVVDVDGLGPKVAKGPADGKGEDEGDDALQDDDDAEEEDEPAVGRHLEELVVEKERGELGKHDGGRVGELEDLAELQPRLERRDGDGGDVMAYAAYLRHDWARWVSMPGLR